MARVVKGLTKSTEAAATRQQFRGRIIVEMLAASQNMQKTASSRMGARRSRRPAGLAGGDKKDQADVVRQEAAPENQNTNDTIATRKSWQLEQHPVKPAQRRGGKYGAGPRRPSKQALVRAENDDDVGDRLIVVVGEKATALPRAQAGAGRDPARKEVIYGPVEHFAVSSRTSAAVS